MLLLILGLTLWSGVHFIPSIAPSYREQKIKQWGEFLYKGIFSLLLVASIILMVVGWKTITPSTFYIPLAWGKPITLIFLLMSCILFVAGRTPNNIKRFIRHPQLTGLCLFSLGHLFSNGDNRSIVLFVMLGTWAIAEIILINKREGAWIKPQPLPFKTELLTLIIGIILFAALLFIHPYLSGIALIN